MRLAHELEHARPLRDASEGELVEILDIVFESLRDVYPTLGIAPGQTLRCEGSTPWRIVLRRQDGRRVEVDPFYAWFIGIRHAERGPHLQSHSAPAWSNTA
jgi:hypothetical protein